jgi:hypothetical protein
MSADFEDHAHNVFAHGIHLGVEFKAGHAVAEIDERGALVPCHQLVPVFERRKKDDPGFDGNRLVILGSDIIEVLNTELPLVKGRLAALQHLLYPGRDFVSGLFHLFHRLGNSDGIPGFKGPQPPGKAPLHGIVHIDDVVGDFRNPVGCIDQGFRKGPEGELTGQILCKVEGLDLSCRA